MAARGVKLPPVELGRDAVVDDAVLGAAAVLWDYHRLDRSVSAPEVAVVFGSHDLGVADVAAAAHLSGDVPLLVMSGAVSPGTTALYPDGEAVAYRDRALALGVPDDALLVEDSARNTGQNVTMSAELLSC